MSQSQREILQQILSVTQKIQSYFPTNPIQNALPPLNVLPLKLEDSISHFQSEMLKHGVLSQIAEVALKRAHELSSFYQKSFTQLCEGLSTSPQGPRLHSFDKDVARLRSVYCSLFRERDIPRLLESVIKTQSRLLARSVCCPINNKRSTFNHKYTPLLEKYFERNAYPSTADRLTLARRTGMSSRQIEVWFQNHRNRAKKHNIPLKRSNTSVSAESLFAIEPFASDEQQNPSDDDVSDSELSILGPSTSKHDSPAGGFVLIAPSHAFPCPYPPSCAVEPFPREDGVFKFAAPVWPRHPTNTPVRQPTITADELASLFASKLNLREVSGKKQTRHSSDIPWFSATVTRPSPAPHPAFVASCRSSEPRRLKLACEGNRTPVFSRPTLSINEPVRIRTGNGSQLRKAMPLPRRVPSVFHGTSQTSTPLGSRNSSTSSIASTNSDVASSTFSLGPTTPPISPISFAQDIMTSEDLQLFQSLSQWTSDDFLACHQPHDKQACFNLFPDLLCPSLNYLAALPLAYA